MTEEKTCKACGKQLPNTSVYYFADKKKEDGLMIKCKECVYNKIPVNKPKIIDGMQRCSCCNEYKPLNVQYFGNNKSSKSGFRCICKECRNKNSKQDRATAEGKLRRKIEGAKYRSKEGYQEQQKAWRTEHKQALKEYDKDYYKKYGEGIRKRVRTYAHLPHNIEKMKQYGKEYYQKNKETVAQNHKHYRESTHGRELIKAYTRKRRKEDKVFRAKTNIYGIIHNSLKGKGIHSRLHRKGVCPYTPQELITHFSAGLYTYDDYCTNKKGAVKFHIDHIIPINYYLTKGGINSDNLYTEKSINILKKANSLRNLRIIPASENASKSDKLDMDLIKEYGIEDLLI